MDSRNGAANYKIKAIEEAIQSGKLSNEEIRKRLTYAISLEYEKELEERDNSFILTCEKILYEMHKGEAYISRKEENQKKLVKELDKTNKNHKTYVLRVLWRTAVIACSIVFFLMCAELLIHRKWLEGTSTEDGQQHLIAGDEIGSEIMEEGIAVINEGIRSIYTSDIDELISFLGYQPHLPSIGIADWKIKEYSAIATSTSLTLSTTYTCDFVENELLYSVRTYYDIESAQNWIEQNKEGETREINGSPVYFTNNYDNNLCIWSNETTCYTLFGPLPYEQLVEIILSIKEIEK